MERSLARLEKYGMYIYRVQGSTSDNKAAKRAITIREQCLISKFPL